MLAIQAPSVSAPVDGRAFEEQVSAPAASRSDVAILVSATLSVAEDLDEEDDQDEATLPAVAALRCAPDAGHQATGAWSPCVPRLPAYSPTGPPTL